MPTPDVGPELSFKNPRRTWSDSIPVWIRVYWKKSIASVFSNNPHHHIIIPKTANHAAWILGAQPDSAVIEKLRVETGGNKIHIVSMLTNHERIVRDDDEVFDDGHVTISRMPWFDHGVLSLTTGKNQTVDSMRVFQKGLYTKFTKNQEGTEISAKVSSGAAAETTIYCHCMAGRSRSFLETMTFLYFYPDKEKLFDFDNWPTEIKDGISADLKTRLRGTPSFSDIAEFVKLRRPKVKLLPEMDGDQAGLIGIMVLSKAADEIELIKERDINTLRRDARDIGLMLKAPLDQGFRDVVDRMDQAKNLIAVYKSYKNRNINLLMAMIAPVNAKQEGISQNFETNFNKLSPSEQARFAILMQALNDAGCDLSPIEKSALEYGNIALKRAKKLTAGDQVELLRTFGSAELGFSYTDVMKKILTGSSLDRHNTGTQLAELFYLAKNDKNPKKDTKVINAIKELIKDNTLGYEERFNFIKRLVEVSEKEDADVKELAAIVKKKYDNRWPLFSKPLSYAQEKFLQDLQEMPLLHANLVTVKSQSAGSSFANIISDLLVAQKNGEEIKAAKLELVESEVVVETEQVSSAEIVSTIERKMVDVDLDNFKKWINKEKERFTPEDKQQLVRKYMCNPNNPAKQPGDSAKLAIILSICGKEDLGQELLHSLPALNDPQVAKTIAELPNTRAHMSWQRASSSLIARDEQVVRPS